MCEFWILRIKVLLCNCERVCSYAAMGFSASENIKWYTWRTKWRKSFIVQRNKNQNLSLRLDHQQKKMQCERQRENGMEKASQKLWHNSVLEAHRSFMMLKYESQVVCRRIWLFSFLFSTLLTAATRLFAIQFYRWVTKTLSSLEHTHLHQCQWMKCTWFHVI